MKPYPLILFSLLLLSCKQQSQPVAPQTRTLTEAEILQQKARAQESLKLIYDFGERDGYNEGRMGTAPTIMGCRYEVYSDPDERKKYVEGYLKGMKDGYEEYCKHLKAAPVKPEKSTLPQGYQDGYEDGYEDGCDNDYKDSWNPKSKERQYLIDYNEGYNEGFESGRLDYFEDYYLEGDFEEDWW